MKLALAARIRSSSTSSARGSRSSCCSRVLVCAAAAAAAGVVDRASSSPASSRRRSTSARRRWRSPAAAPGRTSVLVFTMPFWTLLLAWPVLDERVRGMPVARDRASRSPGSRWSSSRGTGRASSRPSCGRCCRASAGRPGPIATKYFQRARELRHAQLHRVADADRRPAADCCCRSLLPLAGDAVERRPTCCCCSTGALSTALGFLLWIAVLRFLPAGTASLNMLAIPVIALLSSMLIFGERLDGRASGSASRCIGAGLVIISLHAWRASAPRGSALTCRRRRRSKAASRAATTSLHLRLQVVLDADLVDQRELRLEASRCAPPRIRGCPRTARATRSRPTVSHARSLP